MCRPKTERGWTLTRKQFLAGAAALAASYGRPAHAASDRLTILQTEPPRSMDPADHTATYTAAVLAPMYEGLTQFDATFATVPCLATAWHANAEGTEWRFTLRPDVAFHDGAVMDAAAVAASFQRHIDPKQGMASSGRFRSAIASVTAADAQTVVFALKAPYPALLRLLATNNAAIVSPAATELARKAVGTGPYRFVEWSSGDYVAQASNPNYWGAKAAIPTLRWTWSSEAAVMNMAVRTGEADIVNPLPPAFAGPLKSARGVSLLEGEGSAVFWLALNTQFKPLDDVRVRQALNWATDRAGLVRTLYYGFGTPADSPLPPVSPFHDAAAGLYGFDPAKARALLKEAGHPDGITFNVAVQEPQANLAEALQGMWAQSGITLDVQRMESGVWTQAAFGSPEQKAERKTASALASWSTGFIDPDLQFRPLYATDSWAPKGANLGFYSNPKLDALLDRAGTMLDAGQRRPLYAEAQRIVQEDAPMVLLYVARDLAAVRSDVSGVTLLPGGQVMVAGARRA